MKDSEQVQRLEAAAAAAGLVAFQAVVAWAELQEEGAVTSNLERLKIKNKKKKKRSFLLHLPKLGETTCFCLSDSKS